MYNKKLILITIFFFIVLGLFFRLYKISSIPDMHLDEMSYAYTSYSYLNTGHDEFNKPPGFVFESLGDYKLSPFAYAAMPFLGIFGLEPFGIRIVSAIFGLGTVLLFYLLINRFFQNKTLSLISSLLLFLSPWHIIFSRTGNESTMQLFCIVAGVYLWSLYNDSQKRKYLIFSIVLFGIGLYTYYSSFVFLPLLLLSLPFIKKHTSYIAHLIPFGAIVVLLLLFILTQPIHRIGQTSFFKHGEINALMSESLSEENSSLPIFATRLIHNKFVLGTYLLSRNYFEHLSYNFLFSEGDQSYSRYSLPLHGPLYIWMLPFILIGIGVCFYEAFIKKNSLYGFFLWWLLIGFIPDSLSYEGTNIQRSLPVLPAIIFMSAVGTTRIYEYIITTFHLKLIRQSILVFTGFIFLAFSFYFYDSYFIHQSTHEPWHRQGWAKEYIQKLHSLAPQYPKTVLAHIPYVVFLFYEKVDPRVAPTLLQHRVVTSSGFSDLSQYRDYIFMPNDCPTAGKLGVLYVCKGEKVPLNSTVLSVIRYKNNVPAHIFITFTEPSSNNEAYKGDRISIIESTRVEQTILPEYYSGYWGNN
jgi:4-amino-4-deoxy-L-arabinose transferase-like glycosyltransferase